MKLLMFLAKQFTFRPFEKTLPEAGDGGNEFRETQAAIDHCRSEGILGVEMEAAALYAFAEARAKAVVCFARVTNQMGSVENDFEKGAAPDGCLSQMLSRGARCFSSNL
jgi:uridine phosphorylase